MTQGNVGGTTRTGRPPSPPSGELAPPPDVPRVAISLTVTDGFKFGCGVLLAALAGYFILIILIAVALLVATILGLPLPFGSIGR